MNCSMYSCSPVTKGTPAALAIFFNLVGPCTTSTTACALCTSATGDSSGFIPILVAFTNMSQGCTLYIQFALLNCLIILPLGAIFLKFWLIAPIPNKLILMSDFEKLTQVLSADSSQL